MFKLQCRHTGADSEERREHHRQRGAGLTQETANITLVRDIAEAIEQEIALAIMFHETWKPSAYDKELPEVD